MDDAALFLIALRWPSALLHRISSVLAWSAKKEVGGVDARGVVPRRAIVADPHPLGNWAMRYFPRETMAVMRFPHQSQVPIPTTDAPPNPRPARIWPTRCINAFPETRYRINPMTSVAAWVTAKTWSAPLPAFRLLPRKRLTTFLAHKTKDCHEVPLGCGAL
jgi:hypothetical protein